MEVPVKRSIVRITITKVVLKCDTSYYARQKQANRFNRGMRMKVENLSNLIRLTSLI